MILTPTVDDAIVKVVDIVAVPGAIVRDSIDDGLTTALTIRFNPTIRLLLACLPATKVLNSWVFMFSCLHRLLWLVTTSGLFNSFSKRGLYPRDVCFS